MTNSNQILFFITIIITYLKGQNVNNPCPNIFRYARDSINGEIMGFLRIPASVQQLQYTVKFKTTVPVKLNSNYVGKIEELEKRWEQGCAAIRNGKLHYKIHFPIQNPLPVIESISVNDQQICLGSRSVGLYVTSMYLQHNIKLDCPHNFAYSPPPLENLPWSVQDTEMSITPPRIPVSNQIFIQSPIKETPGTSNVFNFNSPRPPIDFQHISETTQRIKPSRRPTKPITTGPIDDYDDYVDETLFGNNRICGKRARKNGITPLIINGENSIRGDYPWLAGLYHKGNYTCAGNLITTQHIITAAHCITVHKFYELEDFDVVLGAHELSKSLDRDVIETTATQIFLHKDYNNHEEDKADADIAIIKFRTIKFTDYIKPICIFLSMPDITKDEGKLAKVAGWGSDGVNKNTQTIKETNVRIVSKNKCKNSHPELAKLVTSRTFCAGSRGTGPCTGDSGGGIFLPTEDSNENDERYYLRGLVSTSLTQWDTCDVTNYAVYVDVGKFIPWIRQTCRATK